MNNQINNQNGESRIRRVLFNEVSFVVATVGVVSSLLLWIMGPQVQNDTAIQLLKQQADQDRKTITELIATQKNDFHTLQKTIDDMRAEQQAVKESVVELHTIIEERIPKKR